ncbi:MAG TPA: hydantoinase B/oxoprolinase family protein [Stellaceae bacterium]|nr:hydantoinase B/oxoprolinase family protein [Stellaceae bacterium]
MTNMSPLSSTVTFDDLLKANKQQFDHIFAAQTKELGLVGASHRPPTSADLVSASLSSEAAEHPGDLYAMLNERFGSRWSSEVVEHKTERGAVTVLCKLTVDGSSKMQFGSARANGDEGAALRRATEAALRSCADMFGGAVPVEARAEKPAATPSSLARGGVAAPGRDVAAPAPKEGRRLDTVSLDLIENALRNARHEMDAVLFRSAMSPVIREQHDEFPMITDAKGRMIVGQFGSYVANMLAQRTFDLEPGDVILQSDPYKCGGAISHINDWMVLVPVFHQGDLVGFTSMFGHMMDVGGPVPGSMPTAATSIFGEGIRIPPIKLYERGELNKAALDLIMNNTRTPEMNYSDLMAIIAGCRAGEKRVIEICDRFGRDTYKQACEALLDRTNRAMRKLIVQNLPEEPKSFEDYVDDDGRGNGPFKMKLTVWREGDNAYFDWTGTSPQAPGPINFYLHEGMFKMFIGVYMIMVFDPQILFNDGFYDLIHVTMPKGSLMHPDFPAALGCRTHALSRQFDVLGGALSYNAPEMATAAGYGSSPHFLYSGVDKSGRPFQLMEILYGGIPGRPVGDGMDGHSWWPLFENIPTEYLETYYPMLIEHYASVPDTGGAGKHRGGNGIEKIYLLLEEGDISIHDDRHLTQPWGILGGRPGACSEKWLVRKDGTRQPLPSKVDNVRVHAGDRVIFRTAGGGGWGDPLQRDPQRTRDDVARKLMSAEKAREDYGVVLTGAGMDIDRRGTDELRDSLKRKRKAPKLFDIGERKANGTAGRAAHG